MKRLDDTETINDFIFRAVFFSFLFGVLLGASLNTWAYCTLFWGEDRASDIGLILSLVVIVLCAVTLLKMMDKEEAKKHEQI